MLCFLIWVVVTPICSLYRNLSSFSLVTCAVHVIYIFFKLSKNNKMKSAAKLKLNNFPIVK